MGKIISATHRNLAEAIDSGKFRADLYYRLCSDIIYTPSLATN
ncbi:MAG: sigma 54-interacting transcriptional regulator [Moraxellaceae bacterium]|nr:sigma 54-interacting transcriptional regulator [Moraxellaceae bacterium]